MDQGQGLESVPLGQIVPVLTISKAIGVPVQLKAFQAPAPLLSPLTEAAASFLTGLLEALPIRQHMCTQKSQEHAVSHTRPHGWLLPVDSSTSSTGANWLLFFTGY